MSGLDRRGALKLFGAAGVAGLVGACGDDQPDRAPEPASDREVPIGLLVPSEGGYQAIGAEIRNGFRRYLQTTSQELGGHPVVELTADEGDSPETARQALERLLEQGAHAVVGVVSPEALREVAAVAESAHVPLLSANGSSEDLSGGPYLWRTAHVNQQAGSALGEHLADTVSGRVAIIAQDDPLGVDAVAGLQEAFAGAQASDQLEQPIFTEPEAQPGEDFFEDPLAELAALEADAVFCVYAGAAATAFLQQYLAAGLEPERLYATAELTEGQALEVVGADAIGVRTAGNYAAELRGAANQSFAVAYRADFGAPTTYAVASYDAAAVLDTAIRLTDGDPDPRRINLMLGEVGLIDSPRGRWQFNQNRTPTQKWYLREVAMDGPIVSNLVIRQLGTRG